MKNIIGYNEIFYKVAQNIPPLKDPLINLKDESGAVNKMLEETYRNNKEFIDYMILKDREENKKEKYNEFGQIDNSQTEDDRKEKCIFDFISFEFNKLSSDDLLKLLNAWKKDPELTTYDARRLPIEDKVTMGNLYNQVKKELGTWWGQKFYEEPLLKI